MATNRGHFGTDGGGDEDRSGSMWGTSSLKSYAQIIKRVLG